MPLVLVVEDNPDNMLLITDILEGSGYDVIQAMTGLKGVEVALSQKPDVILLDIQLPDIDGYEVLKRIRADDMGKEFIIIAVTSFAMSGDEDKSLAAGFDGHGEKPIDPDKLLNKIQALLKGKQ